GYALLWGMKRALFSSEAGQGSSPIAHSAAKTDEPVREGVVAGLEPFIDTIVVCTLTALVILATGSHNRGPEAEFPEEARATVIALDANADGEQDLNSAGVPQWTIAAPITPRRSDEAKRIAGAWSGNEDVFVIVEGEPNPNTGLNLHRMFGRISIDTNDEPVVAWGSFDSKVEPTIVNDRELFVDYP